MSISQLVPLKRCVLPQYYFFWGGGGLSAAVPRTFFTFNKRSINQITL